MKNFLFLLLIIFFTSSGCASKKQSESPGNNGMKAEQPAVSPSPGTVVAEIQLQAIDKNEGGDWLIDCNVINVLGYGSATKPLPEKLEGLIISQNVMNHAGKENLKKDETLVLVLTGNDPMGEKKPGAPRWRVIDIRNN